MEGESEEQRPMVEEVSQKHEDVILVDILKTYYELCRRSDDKSELIQVQLLHSSIEASYYTSLLGCVSSKDTR